ncbi:MAG: ANTAR domain-containing protein [Marmoricola sp.]
MTDNNGVFQVMAAASAAMVTPTDGAEILDSLVRDCLGPLDAQAAAILVVGESGKLQLLSASSHRSAEIEMLQIQHSKGPCAEAIERAVQISVHGAAALVERWDDIGAAIVASGYDSVDAFPLHWQGTIVGGLNVFRSGTRGAPLDRAGALALADVATLVLVRTTDLSPDEVTARVLAAVADRSTIEQAKGILAYLHHCAVDDAHGVLVRRAEGDGTTLLTAARSIIAEQHSSFS